MCSCRIPLLSILQPSIRIASISIALATATTASGEPQSLFISKGVEGFEKNFGQGADYTCEMRKASGLSTDSEVLLLGTQKPLQKIFHAQVKKTIDRAGSPSDRILVSFNHRLEEPPDPPEGQYAALLLESTRVTPQKTFQYFRFKSSPQWSLFTGEAVLDAPLPPHKAIANFQFGAFAQTIVIQGFEAINIGACTLVDQIRPGFPGFYFYGSEHGMCFPLENGGPSGFRIVVRDKPNSPDDIGFSFSPSTSLDVGDTVTLVFHARHAPGSRKRGKIRIRVRRKGTDFTVPLGTGVVPVRTDQWHLFAIEHTAKTARIAGDWSIQFHFGSIEQDLSIGEIKCFRALPQGGVPVIPEVLGSGG